MSTHSSTPSAAGTPTRSEHDGDHQSEPSGGLRYMVSDPAPTFETLTTRLQALETMIEEIGASSHRRIDTLRVRLIPGHPDLHRSHPATALPTLDDRSPGSAATSDDVVALTVRVKELEIMIQDVEIALFQRISRSQVQLDSAPVASRDLPLVADQVDLSTRSTSAAAPLQSASGLKNRVQTLQGVIENLDTTLNDRMDSLRLTLDFAPVAGDDGTAQITRHETSGILTPNARVGSDLDLSASYYGQYSRPHGRGNWDLPAPWDAPAPRNASNEREADSAHGSDPGTPPMDDLNFDIDFDLDSDYKELSQFGPFEIDEAYNAAGDALVHDDAVLRFLGDPLMDLQFMPGTSVLSLTPPPTTAAPLLPFADPVALANVTAPLPVSETPHRPGAAAEERRLAEMAAGAWFTGC